MENKSKKLLILLGVIVVIVLIIIAAVSQGKKQASKTGDVNLTGTPSEEGAVEAPVAVSTYSKELKEAEVASLKDARVAAPGANPITKDNQVVTPEGKPVETSARVMAPEAPRQTGLLDKTTLSETIVKVNVSAAGFSPKEFVTKAGAPTSFALTSADDSVHVFTFDDPSLSAVAILVGPGQTKAITFPAPTTAGEYTFRCDSPGHADRGEVGKMIVK